MKFRIAIYRNGLAAHPDERRGPKGTVRQSNRTDTESAKMATSKGVIQGYTGVAAVDKANQIIVAAQAHGTGSEQEVLLSMVTALAPVLPADSLLTADAGYHSEANLQALAAREVDALIADGTMRQRDERFATQARHLAKPDPLHDKSQTPRALPIYQPSDVTYDAEARTCVCPAGKASIALRYAVVAKWTGSGSCSAWCRTSRSSRTMGTSRKAGADRRRGTEASPSAHRQRMPR